MYVIFLQCTHCVKKTLTVSCTLLCESGDRVMVDQSSFSADLHAVMSRHHCSEYGSAHDFIEFFGPNQKSLSLKMAEIWPIL